MSFFARHFSIIYGFTQRTDALGDTCCLAHSPLQLLSSSNVTFKAWNIIFFCKYENWSEFHGLHWRLGEKLSCICWAIIGVSILNKYWYVNHIMIHIWLICPTKPDFMKSLKRRLGRLFSKRLNWSIISRLHQQSSVLQIWPWMLLYVRRLQCETRKKSNFVFSRNIIWMFCN